MFEGFDQFSGIESHDVLLEMASVRDVLKKIAVRTVRETEIYEHQKSVSMFAVNPSHASLETTLQGVLVRSLRIAAYYPTAFI
jgi:hypothetical protein